MFSGCHLLESQKLDILNRSLMLERSYKDWNEARTKAEKRVRSRHSCLLKHWIAIQPALTAHTSECRLCIRREGESSTLDQKFRESLNCQVSTIVLTYGLRSHIYEITKIKPRLGNLERNILDTTEEQHWNGPSLAFLTP